MSRLLQAAAALLFASSALACDAPPAHEPDLDGAKTQQAHGENDPEATKVAPGTHAIDDARVVWPAREAIATSVVAKMSPDALDAVSRAALPVLMPRQGSFAEKAKVITKPAWVAVSTRPTGEDDGLTISISATKLVHRVPGVDPARATSSVRDGKPAWITQNEGIWSVTWDENGVSYVVDMECSRPGEDARCANQDRVVALVEDLVFVGGSFAVGGAK